MNERIISFYYDICNLKSTIRTGWGEVGIPKDKIESVADHVFGCMGLAMVIASEKDYNNLDLLKVFKMLVLKEVIKGMTTEISITSADSNSNKRDIIVKLTDGLKDQQEYLAIYDECVACETEEAKFVLYVSKLESDLQAKKYELDGDFTLEHAIADVNNYPEDIKKDILPNMKKASDGWLMYDRRYYNEDPIFVSLSDDIQNLGE